MALRAKTQPSPYCVGGCVSLEIRDPAASGEGGAEFSLLRTLPPVRLLFPMSQTLNSHD